jgi:S1-C subfamily serine protease
MSAVLQSLSSELADAVASAGRAVVAIHARRRIPASGVHWRPGVIVATNHTINRDDKITVTLPDATTAPATLAGRDPSTDLAVLKVAATGLATASPRPDEPPRVGELVLALGRPGPGLTASWGVVSSVDGPWRTWQGGGGEIDALARLDVAIYDGFSGGPLIDAAGRVLGINTSALARGAALAIPVATVERTVAELLERGTIRRAYLGIGTQPVRVPRSLLETLQLTSDLALLVVSVEPGGPADRAGLLLGDVLLELDGTAVRDPGDVLAKLGRDRVGQPLAARVIRGGQVKTVTVTAGERPESRAA